MTVIAIVGTGIAGDEAAITARQTDPETRIIMVGREAYPLYSACVLADFVSGEISADNVFLRKKEDYSLKGIELLLSTPVVDWSPDKRLLSLGNAEISFDRLVLATGSKPFVPPIPGIEKEGVLVLKTFDDAEAMRSAKGKSAVVIGSGPIGIEAAAALRRRGWSVAIVELMGRILPRLFDIPLTDVLTRKLTAEGIQIFPGEKVIEIIGGKNVEEVRTDKQSLKADMVVVVVGMRPETQLAEKAGLTIGVDGGIQVDNQMKTSCPGVWACGDCAVTRDMVSGKEGLYMLWSNARLQGRVAGANACRKNKKYPGSLNITTVNFFEQAAASAGILMTDLADGESQVLHQEKSWGSFWLVMQNDHLVGIQVIGQTERIGGLTGLLLKKQNLRKSIMGDAKAPAGREMWAMQGFQRDLRELLR
ncbi:NAD(P)/FAD-dependent oxidoreductase [Thermodesulfobacteriota bacterium]